MSWSCAALQEMRMCLLTGGSEGGLCWPESSQNCGEYSSSHVAETIYYFISLLLRSIISYFIKSSKDKKMFVLLYIDFGLSSKSAADMTNSLSLNV